MSFVEYVRQGFVTGWRRFIADDEVWLRRVAILSLLLATVSIALSVFLFAERERREAADERAAAAEALRVQQRRDEVCSLFERVEEAYVARARRSIQYLEDVRAGDRPYSKDLVPLVVQELPRTLEEGRTFRAPDYCDGEDLDGTPIGLAEPKGGDPSVPAPRDFSDLLKPPSGR